MMFIAAISPIALKVAALALPMWGVNRTPRSRQRAPSRQVLRPKKVASYGPLYVKGEKNPFLPDSSQFMPWS